jgi:uncharacterized protein YciI
MPKQHFHFKLIPPRPTFAQDASAEELAIMKKHSDYFDEQFRAGKLLLYGLVLAQEGAFGIGILEVENEAEAREFGENDPSVLAGLNRFEIAPMKVSGSQATGNRK